METITFVSRPTNFSCVSRILKPKKKFIKNAVKPIDNLLKSPKNSTQVEYVIVEVDTFDEYGVIEIYNEKEEEGYDEEEEQEEEDVYEQCKIKKFYKIPIDKLNTSELNDIKKLSTNTTPEEYCNNISQFKVLSKLDAFAQLQYLVLAEDEIRIDNFKELNDVDDKHIESIQASYCAWDEFIIQSGVEDLKKKKNTIHYHINIPIPTHYYEYCC